jgi:hypothetical protein
MPTIVSNAGQCLIGCAWARAFIRNFCAAHRGYVAAVTTTVIARSPFGGLLRRWRGCASQSGNDGSRKGAGGFAEMCITAKVLQLGVPMVHCVSRHSSVALLLLTARFLSRVANPLGTAAALLVSRETFNARPAE